MRKSTLRAVIALFLVAILGVSAWLIGWQITGNKNPLKWGKDNDDTENVNTSLVINEGGSNGVTMTGAVISPSAFARYGISEQADSAYTLSIVREPSNSLTTDFSWSVEFTDGGSAWASGKDVNDYMTVTPSENNMTATVVCNQAFGEQIRVKAVYNGDTSIFATKTADYVSRVTGHVDNSYLNEFISLFAEYDGDYSLQPMIEYGVGTVKGSWSEDTRIGYCELSDSAYQSLTTQSAYYQFVQNNSGASVNKTSTVQGSTFSDWFSNPTADDFVSGNVNNWAYYYQAFRNMLENTTNQIRIAIEFTYSYGNSYSETVTVYSDWGTIPANTIVLLNGMSLAGPELVF